MQRHARPAVAQQHDPRRLLGEPLAHHELDRPARRREPGRGAPIDRPDVVARSVRPGTGGVGADATADAAERPELEAVQRPPGNEREAALRVDRLVYRRSRGSAHSRIRAAPGP